MGTSGKLLRNGVSISIKGHHVSRRRRMRKTPDYKGVAKVFWSGRSQAVRLPAACRFQTTEVEIIKQGDRLTLRPKGKNWAAYFESDSRGSLPERCEPRLDEREGIR